MRRMESAPGKLTAIIQIQEVYQCLVFNLEVDMGRKRKDTYVSMDYYWGHLRPYAKKFANKAERRKAKVLINRQLSEFCVGNK